METCTLRERRTWLPGRDFPTQPLLLQEQCLPPRHSPWCCGGSGAPHSTRRVPALLETPGAMGTAAGTAPFLNALLPSQVRSLELRGPDPAYSGRTGPLGAWL